MCLCAMVSCAERREYREALGRAQEIIEERPDSALTILDSLGQHSPEFGYRFRMEYLLYRTYAEAKTGKEFDTDSLTRELVDYFGDRSSGNEPALAYYMHGCALMDIGRAPESLQSFYDAINRADTVNNLPACRILRGIYGQMAGIFHKQNLPQDEIWAWENCIECVKITSSEEEYIETKGQLIRPYCLLDSLDKVLSIIDEEYQSLKRLGKYQEAADALSAAIHIYTDRGQLSEAERCMTIFERESGAFDSIGNISKGREYYYYTKGKYELARKNIDSAEKYFRKAIKYGYLSEGCKGLLHVYRERGNQDSIVHFSVMYEAAQDTLHDRMRTDAIHQMASLYNYTRSEKEAEIAREQAQRNRALFMWAVFCAAIIIGGLFLGLKKITRKKKQRIAKLERDLNLALDSRNEIQEELLQLKAQDYEAVIAAKEVRLAELSATIEQLQADNDAYKAGTITLKKDNPDSFKDSEIAKLFLKKANDINVKINTTEREWEQLLVRFQKDNPVIYDKFRSGRSLSKLEMRICILLILDISETAISLMTETAASVVSNSKTRANEKLFAQKEASSLKSNLFQFLRNSIRPN